MSGKEVLKDKGYEFVELRLGDIHYNPCVGDDYHPDENRLVLAGWFWQAGKPALHLLMFCQFFQDQFHSFFHEINGSKLRGSCKGNS